MKKVLFASLFVLFLCIPALTSTAKATPLSELPEFTLSSGAGAWATSLKISPDGRFEGEYYDTDTDWTNEYNAVTHICKFSGSLTSIRQVDTYTFSMKVASLQTAYAIGETWIEDNICYIASDAYGIPDIGGEFLLYLPGHDAGTLPEDFLTWFQLPNSVPADAPSGGKITAFGLYNVNDRLGFYSDTEASSKALAHWDFQSRDSVSDLPFWDVNKSDWFYDGVLYTYQNNLFSGTSAIAFSPNSSMNRAMLVTVLYRLEGQPSVSGSSGFNDVDYRAYYKNAVSWAAARGIVTGTGDDEFSPENPITHEQMAVMLYRYAVLFEGMDSTITTDLSNYKGNHQIESYAKKAVAWCVSNGIITDDALSPKSNTTRAEVAMMLYRLSSLSPNINSGYKQILGTLLRNSGEYAYNRSIFYDLDGDGMEELLSLYPTTANQQRAAIYTVKNGQKVCLLDENAYAVAGAPFAYLGVISQDGRTYVCLQSGNYSGDIDISHNGRYFGEYKIYAISGSDLILDQKVQYRITVSNNGQPVEGNITIINNNQSQSGSYKEYQSWQSSWDWMVKIKA